MNLKTFRAKTMADALAQVKKEFGISAVILHTRTRNEGVRGRLGCTVVEITAAKDTFSLPPDVRTGRVRPASGGQRHSDGASAVQLVTSPQSKVSQHGTVPPRVTPGGVPSPVDSTVASLSGELSALRSAFADLASETRRARYGHLAPQLQSVVQPLIESCVSEDIAEQLARRLRAEIPQDNWNNPEKLREALSKYVASMLPSDVASVGKRTDGPNVVALVGSTGVGKTTTIAKLAANIRIHQKNKVALLTTDTVRVGAYEQLQCYADIIEVPIRLVATADQMRDAVEQYCDYDVILVDTHGVRPDDSGAMDHLKCMLDAARTDEVHLVLSANMADPVLHHAVRHFARLGVDHLIFSKLDEAVGLGVVLNCLSRVTAKLSFVTTGQNVPDDLRAPRSSELADWIVAGQMSL